MGSSAGERVRVTIGGMVAVHAVRAAWTALAAVPGVRSAEVTMSGATLETDGPLDRAALEAALEAALAAAGLTVVAVEVEARRTLPVL